MPPPLHSQVGFYLLPPEPEGNNQNNKVVGKSNQNKVRYRSNNHLDVIAEASEESRGSTPNSLVGAGPFTSPRLLR